MMRKLAIIITLIMSFSQLLSQTKINVGYMISEGWESLPIIVKKDFGKSSIGCGIGLGKNAMLIYHQNNVFRRQMYGENFFQRISYHLGYEYNFKIKDYKWYPSLFVQLTYSHAPLRSRIFLPDGYDENGELFYRMIDKYSTPVDFIEGYFGLMVTFEVLPRICYTQTIGAGGFYALHYQRSVDGIDEDVGFTVSWGLSYQF